MTIEMTKAEYISYFETGAISLWSRDICKYEGKYYAIECPSNSNSVVLLPIKDPTIER